MKIFFLLILFPFYLAAQESDGSSIARSFINSLNSSQKGKTLFALVDWVVKNDIKNVNILFIHTGGIQGGKEIAKKEGSIFF